VAINYASAKPALDKDAAPIITNYGSVAIFIVVNASHGKKKNRWRGT